MTAWSHQRNPVVSRGAVGGTTSTLKAEQLPRGTEPLEGESKRWTQTIRRPWGNTVKQQANLKSNQEGNQICLLLDRVPDRKSTRLNSSHVSISYAVFCLKKKNRQPARR